MLAVLAVLFAFLVFDYHIIRMVFAQVPAPTGLTSWIRALPLQPTRRSVYVQWNASANAAWYRLEYSNYPFSTNSPTNTFTVLTNSFQTGTSYIHNNLSDNFWYVYRVQAVAANGNISDFSNAHGVPMRPAGLKWEEVY